MAEKVLQGEISLHSNKKKVIGIIILILTAIATGIVSGIFYLNNFVSSIDYGNYSEVGLRDNEVEIVSKHGSKGVANLNGVNAFIIAEHKLTEKSSITLNAEGSIDAMGVKQNMYTTRYKNGNSYYVENISKGQVILGVDTNIAERDYYDSASDSVKVYKGKDIQETTATFKDLSEEMPLEQWKEKNGTTPITFQPYIVSSKTIIEQTSPTACKLDNGEQGYSYKLSLQPSSAYLYVKQIKNLSGLGDYPEFKYINLEIFLNQDGTFNKIIANEEYKVKKMGMKVSTISKLVYKFEYTSTEIPTI